MQNKDAKTPKEYLDALPSDRKAALSKVRSVIKKNLPAGYKEAVRWGMITYEVPLSRYPSTYNGAPLMYAALANHKNYMAVYLTAGYGDKEADAAFRAAYKKTGKKLDMGKSCVRFKQIEDLPLTLIGKTIATTPISKYIKQYEKNRTGKYIGSRSV